MWLLVGLGNPEARYLRDRHNIGFRVIDRFSERFGIPCRERQRDSLIGQGHIHQESILLVKPQTYMNLSGREVGRLSRLHHIPPEKILIVHDDLNLDFSRLLIKKGGSHGGHNGLRSIIEHLQTRDFGRLRFGIGRPSQKLADIADYVLSPFSPEEEEVLAEPLDEAVEILHHCVTQGIVKAMNRFNRKKQKPPAEEAEKEVVAKTHPEVQAGCERQE